MTLLFHCSDLHFGAEDRSALDWFADRVQEERPQAIIITGDLTMRARRREFAAASDWLAKLRAPITIEVGNHDLPYFNLFERFFAPYRRYRMLKTSIERPLDLPGVSIVPLKTTARFQWRLNWSKGYVSKSALAGSVDTLATAPANSVKIVTCHHPLVEAGTQASGATRGGRKALDALAKAGADAFLSGHVHDGFDVEREVAGHRVRLIGAGTLSERLRKQPPGFNRIEISDGSLKVRRAEMT